MKSKISKYPFVLAVLAGLTASGVSSAVECLADKCCDEHHCFCCSQAPSDNSFIMDKPMKDGSGDGTVSAKSPAFGRVLREESAQGRRFEIQAPVSQSEPRT